ncbi:MAG: DMT family transporter [Proteobacteria bacterium]|nr:DMT family transporter [Pseudomonadota bacterium]
MNALAMPKPLSSLPLSSIAMIVASVLCFSVLDSTVKYLSPRYPVPLIVWLRWVVQAVALVIVWGPTMGRELVRTAQPRVQLARGLGIIASSILFTTALKYLPLGEATALNYSTPLMVAVLAAFVLHEKLTGSQLAFIGAGLVGMLLIVRPGSAVFQPAAFFALGSACCYSVFTILTRTVGGDDPRVSLFIPAVVGAAVMTGIVPFVDRPPEIRAFDVVLLVVGSLIATCGHFLFILAFRQGPVASLTPFSYFQIVFATLIGWFMFDTFPSGWALAGMLIIAASGLLITLQARRQQRLDVVTTTGPAAVD